MLAKMLNKAMDFTVYYRRGEKGEVRKQNRAATEWTRENAGAIRAGRVGRGGEQAVG